MCVFEVNLCLSLSGDVQISDCKHKREFSRLITSEGGTAKDADSLLYAAKFFSHSNGK